jgi:NADH-quinone oxidoreductase subunit N
MPLNLAHPGELSLAILPELVLFGGAMLLALWSAWKPESASHQRSVGLAGLVLTLVTAALVIVFAMRGYTADAGPIAIDAFRWAADLILLLSAAIALAMGVEYNARHGIFAAESHVLVLFATGGMMILAAARDLMVVFLAFELMSIAVYVLAGTNRRNERSAEAALKYFLLGAFAAGFLLYGIALVYGATGTTNIALIGERIVSEGLGGSRMLLAGMAMLLIGFAFKISAVPFHMWAPDVYEGSPTPIAAYMAAGVKAGAFAVLMRIWIEAFPDAFLDWHYAVWWLAAITMVIGNVIALQQRNVKRMLAYSSIAHSGYLLVALAAGTPAGSSAFLFYLVSYTLATMGAFAVVSVAGRDGGEALTMDSLAGLWKASPWLAGAMAVFMLALLGFPIFGGMGFFAKWYIIQSALQAPSPQTRLVVVLVLASVISAGYYLHVVMVMFMKDRRDDLPAPARMGGLNRFVIGAAAVILLIIGIFPDALATYTRDSAVPAGGAAAQVRMSSTTNSR